MVPKLNFSAIPREVLPKFSMISKHVLLCCGLLGLASIFALFAQQGPESSDSEEISFQAAQAQDKDRLGLPDLLKLAEKNKTLLSAKNALRRSAELKKDQVSREKWLTQLELTAFTGVVPEVDADTPLANRDPQGFLFNTDSNDFENGFSLDGLGPFLKLELKAVQPVWTWGKVAGFENMAELNVELTEVQIQSQVDMIRQKIKDAYYALLFSREALDVLSDVRSKLEKAEAQVDKLLAENSDNVTENDRLKIRVFQADVENRSLDATKGLQFSKAALSELIGRPVESWEVSDSKLEAERIAGVTREAVIKAAEEDRAELKMIKKAIQIKAQERRTLKADLYPTIFVAGELNYAYAPGRTDVSNPYLNDPFNTFNLGGALGIRQDLGIHRSLNKIERLDADIAKLEAQAAVLRSTVRLEAQDSFEKALAAQKAIQISETGFRAARSWLTSTGLSFSLGTTPTKDVLESYAAYFKARIDLLRSLYELNRALSELSRRTGSELVERLQ